MKEKYDFNYTTKCDVEIITHLYVQGGVKNIVTSLDGEFAFCLVDVEKNKIVIGRDPYGVRPLFRLRSSDGHLAICSESKVRFLNLFTAKKFFQIK